MKRISTLYGQLRERINGERFLWNGNGTCLGASFGNGSVIPALTENERTVFIAVNKGGTAESSVPFGGIDRLFLFVLNLIFAILNGFLISLLQASEVAHLIVQSSKRKERSFRKGKSNLSLRRYCNPA